MANSNIVGATVGKSGVGSAENFIDVSCPLRKLARILDP
jgi:hypothetical protein